MLVAATTSKPSHCCSSRDRCDGKTLSPLPLGRKLDSENEEIADWLLRLTTAGKAWGFGLCFLSFLNIKGLTWNQRVYRIYRELELKVRIKPRKRLLRERHEPLAVPQQPNPTWSVDFMADQLADGRSSGT